MKIAVIAGTTSQFSEWFRRMSSRGIDLRHIVRVDRIEDLMGRKFAEIVLVGSWWRHSKLIPDAERRLVPGGRIYTDDQPCGCNV